MPTTTDPDRLAAVTPDLTFANLAAADLTARDLAMTDFLRPDGGATEDATAGEAATGPETPSGTIEPAAPRELDLAEGEQVLALLPSLTSVLSMLPPAAFENLLVLTVRHPRKVEIAVERAGKDPRSVGVVPVSASPVAYDGPLWTTDAVSPSDLTGISMRFARGMRHVEPGRGWVVVDGVGTLLMYADSRSFYRLAAHLVGRSRDARVRGVHGVIGEVIADTTLATFRDLYDRTVDFRE